MHSIPLVDMHTHRRRGDAVEVVSYRPDQAWEADPLPRTLGVHPWQAADPEAGRMLERVARAEPLAAIGEIGLDFALRRALPSSAAGHSIGRATPADASDAPLRRSSSLPDRSAQERLFGAQLGLARQRGLPVVLHTVRAFERTMEWLTRCPPRGALFHGFIGSPEQALRAADAGWHLSFSLRSLRSPRTVEALRRLPANVLHAETDTDPGPVEAVYRAMAALRGEPYGRLREQLYESYLRWME